MLNIWSNLFLLQPVFRIFQSMWQWWHTYWLPVIDTDFWVIRGSHEYQHSYVRLARGSSLSALFSRIQYTQLILISRWVCSSLCINLQENMTLPHFLSVLLHVHHLIRKLILTIRPELLITIHLLAHAQFVSLGYKNNDCIEIIN